MIRSTVSAVTQELTHDVDAANAVAHLVAWGGDVFSRLAPLCAATESALSASPATLAHLRGIAPLAADLLRRPDGALVGAGYVAAPWALADAAYWLEWWTVDEPGGHPERLAVETDPAGDTFRDYTTLPWFAVPHATGRPHVTGPYVDYLCTDEYTLTFTLPVRAGGRFAGVVGADVYVRHVERLAERWLDGVDAPAAFVSHEGRVVVSTVPELMTGDLLRSLPVSRLWAGAAVPGLSLTRCGDLPFALLVGEGLPPARHR
jgi:hypothetical protein